MSSLDYAVSENTNSKKSKILFFTVSLKRNILSIIFVAFTFCLVVFSKSNLAAAKSGLKLWANNVVPSLFPFFIATNLLSHTNVLSVISKYCNKIMRPLFNVPGEGAYAFILGLISGYPVGAKIVTDLRNSNLCTKDEGERMLCFTNNSGPLFIIGTIGITLFANSTVGLVLLITHILAALTVGIILGIVSRLRKNKSLQYSSKILSILNQGSNKTSKYRNNPSNSTICAFSNLGEILSNAILESSKTIIMIGGFVVIFSVIISILNTSKIMELLSFALYPVLKFLHIDISFAKSILSGIIELTNGVSIVSSIANKAISTNIVICAFLLGFGGISVMLQVLSITSKSDLSIKKYFLGKLLQGIIAASYTYILLNFIPMLNLNI
ncbi:MAG: sporulation integral membrane protein YlbJ [Clostridia bacterium]